MPATFSNTYQRVKAGVGTHAYSSLNDSRWNLAAIEFLMDNNVYPFSSLPIHLSGPSPMTMRPTCVTILVLKKPSSAYNLQEVRTLFDTTSQLLELHSLTSLQRSVTNYCTQEKTAPLVHGKFAVYSHSTWTHKTGRR